MRCQPNYQTYAASRLLDEATHEKDWANKLKGKAYADSKCHVQESSIKVGNQVLVRAPKLNKLSCNFYPVPRTVIAKHGGELTIERDSASLRRHTSHCKPYQRIDDSELPLNSADSGKSDNDRDSWVDMHRPSILTGCISRRSSDVITKIGVRPSLTTIFNR